MNNNNNNNNNVVQKYDAEYFLLAFAYRGLIGDVL
jgi:hypothetical protein